MQRRRAGVACDELGRLLLLARRDFISRLGRKMSGESDVTTLARGLLLPRWSKPQRSNRSATGSIIAVVMRVAHRRWWAARSVVSMTPTAVGFT